MISSGVIVFREVLEAAIVVGIVLAATRGIALRGLMVGAGIGAGLAGAGAVALFAQEIAAAAAGIGQELLNATVLGTAVAMLGWHNVWMSRHGREMASQARELGKAMQSGSRPVYALAVACGLAVLREGSEVVLFLWGIASAGGSTVAAMLTGGAVGLVLGVAVSFALYWGLLRIPARHLFAVTSWLILFLAAGLAAQGAKALTQAGVISFLEGSLWDTSALLSDTSLVGQLLHTLVGYVARPSGVQVLAYWATLLAIGGLMLLFGRNGRPALAPPTLALLLIGGAGLLFGNRLAWAEFEVFSPRVVRGETELEALATSARDSRRSQHLTDSYSLSAGHAFTDVWFAELEAEWEKEREETELEAVGLTNVIQLTEPGKYAVDSGLLLAYEAARERESHPDVLRVGALLEKQIGPTVNTANLLLTRDVGEHANLKAFASYAWRTRWLWRPGLDPGIEAFGDLGELDRLGALPSRSHSAGAALFGNAPLGSGGTRLAYRLDWLIGLTSRAPHNTYLAAVEIEFN